MEWREKGGDREGRGEERGGRGEGKGGRTGGLISHICWGVRPPALFPILNLKRLLSRFVEIKKNKRQTKDNATNAIYVYKVCLNVD